jgi:hypothetical protein
MSAPIERGVDSDCPTGERSQAVVVAERVYQSVLQLPEPFQAEVLNFTEYLLLKAQQTFTQDDENAWPSLSLALAMRGMEHEDTPEYTVADLKERFS